VNPLRTSITDLQDTVSYSITCFRVQITKKNGQEKYNITSLPNIETLCQRDSEVNDVNGQSQHYFEMIKISLALLEHSPDNKCMIMQCKLALL
jgi:hypothetical protein